MAYLHDTKLVDNWRKLQHEVIISDLEYADDVVPVAESWDDLKSMLDNVPIHCRDLGLTISCSKTKTGIAAIRPLCKACTINLFPDGDPVKVVSNFQYFGSVVQDNCGTAIEVDSRICKASKVFFSLCHILWYQCKIKLSIIDADELQTLLYGLESLIFHESQHQDHPWGCP